jgi:diguanylate cyclase (GGDEF)-like protein
METLSRITENACQSGAGAALLYMDLDQFKSINDSMGHSAGDIVLKEIAKRLVGCVRKDDSVFRIGGDEFAILLEDICTRQEIEIVAERVLSSVSKSIMVSGFPFKVGISIGISIYPDDDADYDMLLRKADTAMYFIKKGSCNGYLFYSDMANSI